MTMRTTAFAFTALFLFLASPALAQPESAVDEARARFQEGLTQADAGNHEAARLKFSQAWAVFKSPAVLYNLARTEQLTGHDVEALEHFKLFLRMAGDPKVTPEQRQKAAENISALSKKIAQLDVEVPKGARVTVDGRTLDEAPSEPVAVPPGHHVVEATLDGKIKSSAVDCPAGSVVKVKIIFEVGGNAEPRREGNTSSAGRTIVSGAIGVLGLAGIGAGIGFGLASQSAKDDENAARIQGACFDVNSASCVTLKEARDDVDAKATISTLGYIAGGALLIGAVATFLIWPSTTSKTGTRVLVSPSANGGTIQLGATF